MSTGTSAPRAPARRGRRSAGRWRRRWWRALTPFAVLLVLVTVTMVARAAEEPDVGDAATLVPEGTGPDGSSRLAGLLRERGVAIEPAATAEAAEAALRRDGDAVLFLPKFTIGGAWLVGQTAGISGAHRVVLVAPDNIQLAVTGLPVAPGGDRWASDDRPPGCAVPEAVAAGRATALNRSYVVDDEDGVCYGGGLVRTELADAEVFVVGATDPFRNRRIDEHGNAELALGLLAARDRVIWVGALPVPDIDIELPDLDAPSRGERDRTRDCGFACVFTDYPEPVRVGLVLLALVAVLVALARARRLGPPVSEPLPVAVPAAEVVAGRGRLYQRSQGRGVALTALRAAAAPRIVRGAGLPETPPPGPDEVVAAVADRTGLPPDRVRHILYGPEPETDEELMNAVAALDALVAAVTRDRPGSSRGEAG